jgi:hypothetical protein
MRIHYNPPICLSVLHVFCPTCGDRMRLVMIEPHSSERGAEEMTFHCHECEIELKRITRPIWRS